MSRLLTVPIVVFLLCALVLSIFSLPLLTSFPIVRTTFANSMQVSILANDTNVQGINEIRFGIWSACYYDLQDAKGCLPSKNNTYSVVVSTANETDTQVLPSSFVTHGLAFEPVAVAGIFLALMSSFCMVVIAFWLCVVAIALNLISVGLDVRFFVLVKKGMSKLPVDSQTIPGKGLWLNACTIVLVALAACILFMRHRGNKQRNELLREDVGCCS